MTTLVAKRIFGIFYKELGSSLFNNNIILKSVSDDLEFIIKLGIKDYLTSTSA